MKTIKVTGKGQLRLKPDTTRVTLSLEGTDKEYGKVLERSANDTNELRQLLTGFGFEKSDLKTLQFNVDPEYEGYQEEGVYKQRFIGYRFHHRMKIEFPSDNDRLGRILFALSKSKIQPEFQISYTVKDPEKAKNELLSKAVQDAKEKAKTLTEAAGVELKELIEIDYSFGQLNLEVRPVNRLMKASMDKAVEESYEMDIEPEDIAVSDTVTILFEIS